MRRGSLRVAGLSKVIAFDMGGTSTDVSLIDMSAGGMATTNESGISGVPIAVPMLDIHTVGAGGGSIAYFDEGGILHVGPESAGAAPGPVCYGKGRAGRLLRMRICCWGGWMLRIFSADHCVWIKSGPLLGRKSFRASWLGRKLCSWCDSACRSVDGKGDSRDLSGTRL